jgi:hypothetical protein
MSSCKGYLVSTMNANFFEGKSRRTGTTSSVKQWLNIDINETQFPEVRRNIDKKIEMRHLGMEIKKINDRITL